MFSRTPNMLKAIGLQKPIMKPGSRGGNVIGYTASGKPIYSKHGHLEHANFTSKDHWDAYEKHLEHARKRGVTEDYHNAAADVHYTVAHLKRSEEDGTNPSRVRQLELPVQRRRATNLYKKVARRFKS